MKLTVDDAVISTDIDKLIRFISDKQKTTLIDVERNTGVDKKTIEKWIKVLEDEGYLDIDYRLTSTYLIWKGFIDHSKKPASSFSFDQKSTDPSPKKLFFSPDQSSISPDVSTPVADAETQSVFEPVRLEDPKETPDEGKPVASVIFEDNKNELDMDKMDEDFFDKTHEDVYPNGNSKEILKSDDTVLENTTQVQDIPSFASPPDDSDDEGGQGEQKITSPFAQSEQKKNLSAVSTDLKDYIEQINSQRQELENLKKEKQEFHSRQFNDIEKRMEADIVVLTEKILEKESRLLELKERYLELPDRIQEIEEMEKKLAGVKNSSVVSLNDSKQLVEKLLEETISNKQKISAKIDQIKEEVSGELSKLNSMQALEQEVDSELSVLSTKISSDSDVLSGISSKLDMLRKNLETSELSRNELSSLKDEIHTSIEKTESQLSGVFEELDNLETVEENLVDYIKDYEQRLEEINQSLSSAADELNELRRSVESDQINRYLAQLQEVTLNYEKELDQFSDEEKVLDNKIQEARTRLQDLIVNSRKLIKESAVTGNVSYRLSSSISSKLEETKKVLNDKRIERESLYRNVTSGSQVQSSSPTDKISKPKKKTKKKKSKK